MRDHRCTTPSPAASTEGTPSSAFFTIAPVLVAPRSRRINQRTLTIIVFLLTFSVLVSVVVAGICLRDAAMVTDFTAKGLAPSSDHLFGTDWMGRDLFTRTLAGLSTSILIGLVAATVSALIAIILGAASALGPHWLDHVIMWLVDLMMGVPHIVLLILISFALGKGFWGVVIGVSLTHWPSLTRIIRSEVLQVKETNYVGIARHLGIGSVRIALTHMVPHVFPQFLVGFVLLFPHAILHEASITFLGFGLSPEQPAIGIILAESMSYLTVGMWWAALFPGIALLAVVLLFDLAGGNLRKLIDPHSVQE